MLEHILQQVQLHYLGPSGGGHLILKLLQQVEHNYAAETISYRKQLQIQTACCNSRFWNKPTYGEQELSQLRLQLEEQQFIKHQLLKCLANDLLVVVLDFGGAKIFHATNGTFTVTFPAPASGSPAGSDAIIKYNIVIRIKK